MLDWCDCSYALNIGLFCFKTGRVNQFVWFLALQPFVTDKKKWFSGSDGYKWLGKELLGLDKVSTQSSGT